MILRRLTVWVLIFTIILSAFAFAVLPLTPETSSDSSSRVVVASLAFELPDELDDPTCPTGGGDGC